MPAQNLVPNGSFEDYTMCPTYFGLAGWCIGWQNLYTQSADYFHVCHTNGIVGVPMNQFGYQYPSDSNAYMGMITYAFNQPEYREMVGIHLAEPLEVGIPICVSFKVAVGGFGTSVGASAGYTCKGVGIRFYSSLPTGQYIYDYPNSAALYLDEVPTDTALWYHVEGTYTPDSAYEYLVVGNFFSDSLNEPVVQDSIGFTATDVAYVFLDDVRASFNLNYCSLGLSTQEYSMAPALTYPMPFTDVLNVQLPGTFSGTVQYVLYDMAGRPLQRGTMSSDAEVSMISTSSVPAGMYVLLLTAAQGTWPPITLVRVSP
jgi:hypothetical protein